MSKKLTFSATAALFFILTAFTYTERITGTYGVSGADPSQIKLVLHTDHTFYYQDFSVPEKKIATRGTWVLKGKKAILTATHTTYSFHRIWTFDQNGQVAKSRKGLNFYRLCRISE